MGSVDYEKMWELGLKFPETDMARKLLMYWPPVLLVIGTFGNIFSAVVMIRMFQKVLSTCLYIFVMLIIDLAVLYIRCGNDWIRNLADVDIKDIAKLSSNSVCKIYPFVSDFALHLSTWLAVAMATECAIVTLGPDRLMKICRLERARAVVLLMIVLLVCVNAHCFWTFALVKVEKTMMEEEICTNARQGNQNSEEFRKVVWPVIDLLVAGFFPFFIIFACCVIMITKRVRRKDHMRLMENTWKSYSVDVAAAKQMHLAIIVLCIMHLILLLPKLACDIFLFLVDPNELALIEMSLRLQAKKDLADAISNLLLYVYLSCKVFVFMGTSRTFRRELCLLITCRKCRSGPPTGNTSRVATHQPLLNKPEVNHVGAEQPFGNCVDRDAEPEESRKPFSMTSV